MPMLPFDRLEDLNMDCNDSSMFEKGVMEDEKTCNYLRLLLVETADEECLSSLEARDTKVVDLD